MEQWLQNNTDVVCTVTITAVFRNPLSSYEGMPLEDAVNYEKDMDRYEIIQQFVENVAFLDTKDMLVTKKVSLES